MPTPEMNFALAFILYTIFRVLRGRTGVTWLHLVLALLVIAPLSINSVLSREQGTTSSAVMMAAIAGGMLIVAGGAMFFIERRQGKSQWNQSQGVLSAAAGALVILSVFVSPLISQLMARTTLETVVTAQDHIAESAAALPTPTNSVVVAANHNGEAFVPINTLAPTMPPVQVDAVSADVVALLPTRFIYTTPVPTATPAAALVCEGRVGTYLNVRSGPSVETAVVVSMPPYTSVAVHSRNSDATWLYIEYEGQLGWASAAFVNLSADCHDLPVDEGS